MASKNKCPTTGKRKFTQIKALMVVGNRRDGVGDRPKRETRAYQCEFCGTWHVTSQAKRGR